MDIDTRLLRSFAAVYEERQLTAAAARLLVSQPTLTKQVRQLETLLGVQLFERTRAGVTPTPAAEELARRTPGLLAGWECTVRATRQAATEAQGLLRVGFEGATINLVGLATMADFERRMPGWQARMRQNNWFDVTSGLAGGEIDLALWHAPADLGPEFTGERLGISPRVAVLSTSHPLAHRETIDVSELFDDPFVAIPAEAGFWRAYWLGCPERGDRPARIGAVVHNADEWLAAVACGQGIGFAPEAMRRLASRPDVVYRDLTGLSPSHVGLYWLRDRPLTQAMAAFVESCRSTLTL
ncbi:LysR family transcriptional regulator [Kitasatospora sp. NPDC051853]|uniref:LysR family transcriptional regulator n=1 Tax=Kitasatospora sp. NPDC051853 TaxID=3364058 RepID=UPI0037B6A6D0